MSGCKMKKHEVLYFDHLEKKEAVIVGPAAYMKGLKRGQEIDRFDVVVRVSEPMHRVRHILDLGTRMDVLYLPPSLSRVFITGEMRSVRSWSQIKTFSDVEIIDCYARWRKMGLGWVVGRRVKDHLAKIPFKWVKIDEEYIKRLNNIAGAKIRQTGVIAISHLLKAPVKSLTVMGFDFYASGYYDQPKDYHIGRSKLKDDHLIYLKDLASHDDRLILDENLKRVLL